MKKKALICIMSLVAIFTITGCGNNKKQDNNTTTTSAEQKLQCTYVEDNESKRFNIIFDKDKITKVTFVNSTKFKNEKTAKSKYSDYTKNVSELNKYKGVTASCAQSKETITSTIVFTIANLDEKGSQEYDEIFGELKDKNYDEIKNALTEDKYTCK